MKILVTGAKGFIGENLIAQLRNLNYTDIFTFDKNTEISLLDQYCKEAEFVYHLAGVNRPNDDREYMKGNLGFTEVLLDTLKEHKNNCPVAMSSSIQAIFDNPYGKSKKAGEDAVFNYSKETGAKVFVYRLPNVFGKWCRPNYNSFIATLAHNIARDLPVTVNDPETALNLAYIDDVVEELISLLEDKGNKKGDFCEIPVVYQITLKEVVNLLRSFKESRIDCSVPNMSEDFTRKLYSTYLSYLPENNLIYPLKMNADHRGSFTEFLKTTGQGQISVNVSKPGMIKGNHWHHTKNEKFLVVSGRGVIRFRKLNSDQVIEYYVSGDKLEAVDIPVGYIHHIENIGETDMVTIIWANESFNPQKPDTYFMEL